MKNIYNSILYQANKKGLISDHIKHDGLNLYSIKTNNIELKLYRWVFNVSKKEYINLDACYPIIDGHIGFPMNMSELDSLYQIIKVM